MRRLTLTSARGMRRDALITLVAAALISALVMFAVPGTGALFTADYPAVVNISAGQIFPADHVSPAFSVSDHSSGSASDASSPVAFKGDGRTTTTSAWPVAFAPDHYVELRFNSLLPGNVALSSASFDLTGAISSGTACVYFEVRDQGGTLLDSEGNASSPLVCTSSASLGTLVTPLPSVTTTDDANAATVRLFVASDSAATAVLDQAVLKVTYNSEQFTLYPVDVIDAADGTPSLDHWGLAGP